jgi:hypothetical protein
MSRLSLTLRQETAPSIIVGRITDLAALSELEGPRAISALPMASRAGGNKKTFSQWACKLTSSVCFRRAMPLSAISVAFYDLNFDKGCRHAQVHCR